MLFRSNDLSIRQLAERMIEIGKRHPAYAARAHDVTIREVGSAEFYGKGYEDVQTRVPWIDNTRTDLGWEPKAGMDEILNAVFDAYAAEVTAAARLLDNGPRGGA